MLSFDAESHTYTYAGLPVPSVTTILKPLMSFDRVPESVLERKREIGKAVHSAIELFLEDDLDLETMHPATLPYFEGFSKFLADSGFEPEASEERVFSEKWGYAGTLDLRGRVRGVGSIIDIKCTADLSPVTALQTAAYFDAARESVEGLVNRYALRLKPDGTYDFVQYRKSTDLGVFLSLLNVYRWKQSNLKGAQ